MALLFILTTLLLWTLIPNPDLENSVGKHR